MKKFLKVLICLCLSLSLLGSMALAEEFLDAPDDSKTIDSIEVYTLPDKTVYTLGEEFSAEGGVIKINYTDGTAALIDMTDESVEMSQPTMNTVNTKNVAVKYGGERLTFTIEVVSEMLEVTFDYNYDGAEAETVTASAGAALDEPETPVRDGYTFVGWYATTDYI